MPPTSLPRRPPIAVRDMSGHDGTLAFACGKLFRQPLHPFADGFAPGLAPDLLEVPCATAPGEDDYSAEEVIDHVDADLAAMHEDADALDRREHGVELAHAVADVGFESSL